MEPEYLVLYKKKDYKKKFEQLNYRDLHDEHIRHPVLIPLLIRYHGMGHYQVLCVNPNVKSDHKYLIVTLGGSDGHACENNDREFQKINNESQYYTLKQSYQYAKRTSHGSLC